ncbi:hypothetical protein IMCC21906_03102 [Spongiibacter sp. IMCC21906]|jgi:hypothetical protein|uniref:hypothetical protein n=1 Tax=Spongiibacter sp. IMCC21906 TaxID=1620392 RepID=UPI00062DFAAF|nr:hypothetical protein [Spongiibacter sp. IMCC21906]AKH70742.1 hypothetical protein IMCC21906_03102 [Spongiibacter sp. IMCC21906]
MGEVIPFSRRGDGKKANSLCREGHHKWKIDTAKKFDVKQGKLVTVYRCERCGTTKTTAH